MNYLENLKFDVVYSFQNLSVRETYGKQKEWLVNWRGRQRVGLNKTLLRIILHFFHISGHTSAAAVVVATHTHHHHQHGAVHHARLRSSIEDSPPSLRFMADTVPAQVVDTSVISSASASPKLIVQTDYPVL